jgi:hypothetical protein
MNPAKSCVYTTLLRDEFSPLFYGRIISLCAGVDTTYFNFIYEKFEFLVGRLVHECNILYMASPTRVVL